MAVAAWRTFGSKNAARMLAEAMAGEDEQERMIAGMSLVKAGDKSVTLIENAVAAGRASPGLVRLLADIDSAQAQSLLHEIAEKESGELKQTAEECIEFSDSK